MKKKLFRLALVLAILFAASMLYLNKKMEEQKDPYNVSTVLDDKGVKLYKRGFRLLEEQLATYIKEHYSGVSKIEFSPIFIQGGEDNPPFTADVLPVIYDEYGNRAVMGKRIGKKGYPSYGTTGDLFLDFDQLGNESILLEVSPILGKKIDVSNENHLPEDAKLTPPIKGTDDNIDSLVNDGQLKNVIKSKNGSTNVEIVYNLQIIRGSYSEWK